MSSTSPKFSIADALAEETAGAPSRNNAKAATRDGDSLSAQIIRRLTIEDYLRDLGVTLPSSGKIACPLPDHDETNPSCHVKGGDDGWYCYGCRRGGSVIDLAMFVEGKNPKSDEDRAEAIPELAERLGIETVPPVTVIDVLDSPPGETATAQRKATSWAEVDLAAALAGEGEPPPTILLRNDGAALFYRGVTNALFGESESLKSWAAQVACAQAILAGEHVGYLDFESNATSLAGRLCALGVPAELLLARFHYIRPQEPLDAQGAADLQPLLTLAPALVILDGVTEALSLHGYKINDAEDWAGFKRQLLDAWATVGSAAVWIDHEPKAKLEGGGNGPLGTQHKRSSVEGAAYRVKCTQPFGRGRHGIARLIVSKDRPGHVRGASAQVGDVQVAAELHLQADDDGARITAEVKAHGDSGAFRPTALMEKVSRALQLAGGGLSQRGILDAVSGKRDYVRVALDALVEDGYVRRETGARNALLHHHERTYLADEDPKNPERSPVPRPFPNRSPDQSSVSVPPFPSAPYKGARTGNTQTPPPSTPERDRSPDTTVRGQP